MNRAVKILFPVILLKPESELFDPDNTETVWEYYLLENLSCGLVRDSQFASIGYEGCIADRFYQEDDYTWVFRLRDLKWSDGVKVTSQEIHFWIDSLRSTSKRHIRYLKLADKVSYNETDRQLKIHFPFPMDNTILHELSLADSGLLPSSFKENGWGKTVGPYYVESWDGSKLQLIANRFSPLYRSEMPERATLTKLADPSLRAEIFKSADFDIVLVNASSDPRIANLMLPNAPQVWTSHPMAISFFYFNSKNKLSHIIDNRKQFAEAVADVRKIIPELTKTALPCLSEAQLIPEGFSGRLDSFNLDTSGSRGQLKKVKIKISDFYKEPSPVLDAVKSALENHGIEVEFSFRPGNPLEFNEDEFAGIYGFLGNQLDDSGTWSFLTAPPKGLLSPWMSYFHLSYERIFSSNDLKNRKTELKTLHQEILEKYLAIPFMVGSQRYLLSNSIDASRWNHLDSRLRIYDLQWK